MKSSGTKLELEINESYKRILNRLGYYDYQYGLVFRHLKQDSGWDSHLEKCRSFILKAAETINPLKITVLGSGWLLDLPLVELLETVQSITLIDIVHPPEVINQVSELGNVSLVEEDLTGGLILRVWEEAHKAGTFRKLKTLGNIEIPAYTFKEDPGLVISLNIMSQLHVLPVRYLKRKSATGEEEFTEFIRSVQQKHLDLLSRHRSVLITDTAEIFVYRSGLREDEKSVLIGLPVGTTSEEWTWDFDLKGSDFNEKRSVMKVTAKLL